MIICGQCLKDNNNDDKNGRKMYNIEYMLPKNYLVKNEKGIICGSCLYDLIDKNSNLLKEIKLKNLYSDLRAHKLKFLLS